jgi:hypothetical protein
MPKASEIFHDSDVVDCDIAECSDEAVNVVGVLSSSTKRLYKCRRHTSRWDEVVIGPGPL